MFRSVYRFPRRLFDFVESTVGHNADVVVLRVNTIALSSSYRLSPYRHNFSVPPSKTIRRRAEKVFRFFPSSPSPGTPSLFKRRFRRTRSANYTRTRAVRRVSACVPYVRPIGRSVRLYGTSPSHQKTKTTSGLSNARTSPAERNQRYVSGGVSTGKVGDILLPSIIATRTTGPYIVAGRGTRA